MNKAVNLTKRVIIDGEKRFCPVVMTANNRIRADYVTVNPGTKEQREEHHPEGAYYIEWWVGTKRVRKSVGKDASKANTERLRQQHAMAGRAVGLEVSNSITDSADSSLAAAVTIYLDDIKAVKKKKTHSAYTTALNYFLESCKKSNLRDITRSDLLAFSAYLRDKKKQSPRSCWNKFASVVSFLKANGIQKLAQKNDWPQFVEGDVEIFEDRAELQKFFDECDERERVVFEFFLQTGMREQEVMHVCWSDLNAQRHCVRVSPKPEWNWTPKAYKGREIPISSALLALLKAHKKECAKDCELIFPTKGCQPNYHFLAECQAVARRAGLKVEDFWLHKFRASFCTWSLWAGVDLRTVQSWMGHTDLASTMRYLRPKPGDKMREKVNEIFA
jgi:integrase